MPKLIYETYTTSKPLAGSLTVNLEYGFTFKQEGNEDVEFDLVLGTLSGTGKVGVDWLNRQLRNHWRNNEWVAKAIVEAASKRDTASALTFRFATPEEIKEATSVARPIAHEAISPTMGWQALMYDPMIGDEAWWIVEDQDGTGSHWVVGYVSEPGKRWPSDEAATDAMMSWYWTQYPRISNA